MQKGFTILELLIVIAIMALLTSAVLLATKPAEHLAKARDVTRISGITQLSRALDAYSIIHAGDFPDESARWITDLVEAGEVRDEPIPINYNAGGVAPCNLNEQSYYCYDATTPTGDGPVVVFARLESSNRCSRSEEAYAVYSTADAHGGIVCTTDSAPPPPGKQDFEEPNPSPSPSPSPNPCANSTGNVQVLSPNGGERFLVGDTVEISWCLNNYSQYNQARSSMWLSSRETQIGGQFLYRNQLKIAESIPMQLGLNSYTWKIPQLPNAGSYVILIDIYGWGAQNYDFSDGVFVINTSGYPQTNFSLACVISGGTIQVLTPNGGESFKVGDVVVIKWCLNEYEQYNQGYSQILLYTRETQVDGPFLYRQQFQIANAVYMSPGENVYYWTIPSTVAARSNYVMLVSINADRPNDDFSDNTFTISL